MSVLSLCLPVSFSPPQSVLRPLAKFSHMWWRGISSKILDSSTFYENRQPEWRDFYVEGMAEVGVQPLLANLWSSQCKWWKKRNLWPRSVPSWISFIVHKTCSCFVPFPYAQIPAFIWICTFVCISFKYNFRNPHYFLNCVLPFKNRVFVRPCNAVLCNTKALGFFLSACRTSGRWR